MFGQPGEAVVPLVKYVWNLWFSRSAARWSVPARSAGQTLGSWRRRRGVGNLFYWGSM